MCFGILRFTQDDKEILNHQDTKLFHLSSLRATEGSAAIHFLFFLDCFGFASQ